MLLHKKVLVEGNKHNIVFDLRMIHSSGIGTYLKNIIPFIIKIYPDEKFTLLGNFDELTAFEWGTSSNVEIIPFEAKIYSIAEQLEFMKKIPANTVLFWSPHYNIPLFFSGKLVVTIHDIFHLAMPQFVQGITKKIYAKLMFFFLRQKAQAIISPSYFTKNEINRIMPYGRQSINVIYNGVDESWFNIEKINVIQERPFFLYVGNVKPHKNLVNLVRAFKIIENKVSHDLIIIGKKDGFITGDDKVFLESESLRKRIIFTGYIDELILKQYFKQASALVFPSRYEGFGLPAIEAMACGCPVIVSNVASLPEICRDAALYIDPLSPESIAEKMYDLVTNIELQQSLKEKGIRNAHKFQWDQCAQETLQIFREVLSK